MVYEYTERLYLPAARHYRRLTEAGATRAGDLAEWRARGPRLAEGARRGGRDAGGWRAESWQALQARARVDLGGLASDDVAVEFALGRVEPGGELVERRDHADAASWSSGRRPRIRG